MSPDPLAERQAKALNGFLSGFSLQNRTKPKSLVSTHVPATAAAVASPAVLQVPKTQAPRLSAYTLYHVVQQHDEKVKPSETESLPNHDVNRDEAAEDSGSENEGVKRWLITEPRKPRKITERKRADAEAFDVWLEQNQKALTDDGSHPVPDEERTLAWLVKDDGSYNIIDSPFDYQVELFERAKQQNTIAVLDTGTYVRHY